MKNLLTNGREGAECLGLLLLLLCGCLLVWKLDVACRHMQSWMTDENRTIEEDDELLSEVDDDDEADEAIMDDERRQIIQLKRGIRKNKTIERESSRALQEEAFLDVWHTQVGRYRAIFYDEAAVAEDKSPARSLKDKLEARQREFDQSFEKLEEYLKHIDLSHLSMEEQDALRKYKESWKAWISGAYREENGIEEKMRLYRALKEQDAVIQALLIRNLDHVHEYPVEAYVEKVEKMRDAFHPLSVTKGHTLYRVIEDPENPGKFRRLTIRF